jgi:hypothetical protein
MENTALGYLNENQGNLNPLAGHIRVRLEIVLPENAVPNG